MRIPTRVSVRIAIRDTIRVQTGSGTVQGSSINLGSDCDSGTEASEAIVTVARKLRKYGDAAPRVGRRVRMTPCWKAEGAIASQAVQ